MLDFVVSTNTTHQQQLRSAYTSHDHEASVNWSLVKRRALQRHDEDCAICMSGFADGKAMILLSCSHVFHKACISSFEHFNTSHVSDTRGPTSCINPPLIVSRVTHVQSVEASTARAKSVIRIALILSTISKVAQVLNIFASSGERTR